MSTRQLHLLTNAISTLRREQRKMGNKIWEPKVNEKVIVKAQPASDATVSITFNSLFIPMKAHT